MSYQISEKKKIRSKEQNVIQDIIEERYKIKKFINPIE